ncbi:MAG: hypothetical protein EWM47_07760 [Anaerolineaceae bacterium]|nr:MAG: hypothetical protein EWM47_07760 [Anaerolineaceae bacterium]
MAGFFGFDFQSKKEREKNYQEYAKKIFPFGDAQKEKVLEILNDLSAYKQANQLLMHYILIKEAMIDSEEKDYKAIAEKIEKKRYARLTPEIKDCIRILMDKDLAMDESLDYPTAQELKSIVEKKQ